MEDAQRVAGQEWHNETSWFEVLRDTAVSLNRTSTRQLLLRPPPPESPAVSRQSSSLKASVDFGALDDLIDAMGQAELDKLATPPVPQRDKWTGAKGARDLAVLPLSDDLFRKSLPGSANLVIARR